jgi:hypothetical protein
VLNVASMAALTVAPSCAPYTVSKHALVESALRQSTRAGLAPEALARRAVDAIREGRLYALAPEGDPRRRACEACLDAIGAARNPGMEISGAG